MLTIPESNVSRGLFVSMHSPDISVIPYNYRNFSCYPALKETNELYLLLRN